MPDYIEANSTKPDDLNSTDDKSEHQSRNTTQKDGKFFTYKFFIISFSNQNEVSWKGGIMTDDMPIILFVIR